MKGSWIKSIPRDLRAGKAAGTNLGARWATGDIIIVVDSDSSFGRHAFEKLIEPLNDPEVGAVSGNILARNTEKNMITRMQAIEYLITISLGKQAAALKDQVTCVSGAFGAFRREAYETIGGNDVGGGEDMDLTLRLRNAGWKIKFVPDSICYTDVPDTFKGLTNQRLRWEADSVGLRYRKHRYLMNPFNPRFNLKELLHELDFIFFHIIGAAIMPIYVVWLFVTYGDLGVVILVGAQLGLILLDVFAFLLAAWTTPKENCFRLVPYIPAFGFFNSYVMRYYRLAAYLQEWVWEVSLKDNYVPEKVRLERRW